MCINVSMWTGTGDFKFREIKKLDFTEINHCKLILLGLSLIGRKSDQTTFTFVPLERGI